MDYKREWRIVPDRYSRTMKVTAALKATLRDYKPPLIPPRFADHAKASVMVLVRDASRPTIVLTERTSHLSSHAGEVAWPGGRVESADVNPLAAGLRETFEEIGVPEAAVAVIGELPGEISKFGLWVTPYVGLISADQTLTANPSEVASVFEIPMDWLLANPPSEIERLDRHGETQWAPVYRFGTYRVWGLTALILASLVDISGISDR